MFDVGDQVEIINAPLGVISGHLYVGQIGTVTDVLSVGSIRVTATPIGSDESKSYLYSQSQLAYAHTMLDGVDNDKISDFLNDF